MKKIIRLTESDLTRIVRRVISEQTTSSNTMKLKVFEGYGNRERIANLDLSNMKLLNNQVYFDFKVAGGGQASITANKDEIWKFGSGLGVYTCDSLKQLVNLVTNGFKRYNINTHKETNVASSGHVVVYLSKEGAQKIQYKYCSKYASTNTMPSDDTSYT